MRKPAKTAAVLFGLGVGAAVGPSLGATALWSGVAIATLGVALSLVGTTESDLVGDGPVDHDADAGVAGDGATTAVAERPRGNRQPNLSGLGTRVEQILKLAEKQAANHREEARTEAEGIVSAARQEAEAILNRAHEQAAEITGTRPELPAVSRTQAPSPD